MSGKTRRNIYVYNFQKKNNPSEQHHQNIIFLPTCRSAFSKNKDGESDHREQSDMYHLLLYSALLTVLIAQLQISHLNRVEINFRPYNAENQI